jgi:hypothetical protein
MISEYAEDKLNQLILKLRELKRGCSCEYDYRCGNCQLILDIKKLGKEIDENA